MAPGFRFERFLLDPGNRQLLHDGAPVALNARYLDALTLLVREQGRLVSKDRFLDEVWRGVPVTDEALTQCIRTLRRQLGDDAAHPRFIETVPKHGYRFVATVEPAPDDAAAPTPVPPSIPAPGIASAIDRRRILATGAAGTAGAGLAGVLGGLIYGFAGAAQPLQPGIGAASVLLVLLCLTTMMALIGGAGVAFGVAAAGVAQDRRWRIIGGAAGGLVTGAVFKLLGLDAFNLLFGQSPGDITGAAEGAMLGGAVGLAAWLGSEAKGPHPLRRGIAIAAAIGAVAGMLIPLLGGRLLAGSLDLLARRFPGSSLRLDAIGSLFGEAGLGIVSQVVTGALEGALFAGCITGAMLLARTRLARDA